MTTDIPLSRNMDFEYAIPRELKAGIRRLVANNPGPFTFKGTNTYVVGSNQLAVIDPGPDDPKHLQAILDTADGSPISHIFLTHTHRDHCDGLAALKHATGATTYAFDTTNLRRGSIENCPSGEAFTDTAFRADHPVADGEMIAGPDWALTAIHTPGHAPDHLCFAHDHISSSEHTSSGALFSGDHVMGWSTSVVAPPEGNMGDYMASLERLLGRTEDIFLPGHGGAIRTPARVVKAYIVHRRWRENAILDAIRSGTSKLDDIVAKSYPSLDEKLIPAAALSVLGHVELLVKKGAVSCDGPVSASSTFFPA